MKQQTTSQNIIKFIAKKKMVKYVQFIELSSFLCSGYLLQMDFMYAGIMFLVGIVFAILAGESALLEHDLKKGVKNGC